MSPAAPSSSRPADRVVTDTDPREYFEGFFDEFAATYEQQAFSGPGLDAVSRRELAVVVDQAVRARGVDVVDIGCGYGRILNALSAAGANVVGVDQSAEMAALASKQGHRVVRSRLGDPLPFDDNSFDAVTSIRVLKYLSDWVPALSEMARVVRPGGRVVIEFSNAYSAARFGYNSSPVAVPRPAHVRALLSEHVGPVMSSVGISHIPYPALNRPRSAAAATVDGYAGRVFNTLGARSIVITAAVR